MHQQLRRIRDPPVLQDPHRLGGSAGSSLAVSCLVERMCCQVFLKIQNMVTGSVYLASAGQREWTAISKAK